MVLVDTSIWIDVFRSSVALELDSIVDFDEVVTCLPVVQEVLQGFDEEAAYRLARESMLSLPIVESPLVEGVFLEAADLYRSARRLGVTVRSSVDCLIAICALRNDLTVLHRDRDFEGIARVVPLRVRKVTIRKP